jgi:hydrogenase-4 membrane subunit HyfE
MSSSVIFQIQSIIIVLLLYTGLFNRRNRRIHVGIMSTAIIWDLLLVLQIELNRGAVEKAVKVAENATILNVHVAISVITVLLYLVLAYTGIRFLLGHKNLIHIHGYVGPLALILRTATLITSFFL